MSDIKRTLLLPVMQRLRRFRCWWRYYHRKSPAIGRFRYDQPGICCDCGKVGNGVGLDGE